jgi:hypothetical protein
MVRLDRTFVLHGLALTGVLVPMVRSSRTMTGKVGHDDEKPVDHAGGKPVSSSATFHPVSA